jgi:hypothetical protein
MIAAGLLQSMPQSMPQPMRRAPKSRLTGMMVTLAFACCAWAQSGKPMPTVITIAKNDMPRFIGTLACVYEQDVCPQAMQGFATFGLSGEPGFEDLSALPKDPATGMMPIVLGFNESKFFDLAKYSFDAPVKGRKYIVLNELSTSESNHAMITEWSVTKNGYTLVRILPKVFELPVGEVTVAGKPVATGSGLVVLLRGLGSDAGLNLQDFRVVRIDRRGDVQVVARETNRSETPVGEILARLNDDQDAEVVIDSALTCTLARGGKVLKCTKAMTQVSYSKSGTTENPIGKTDFSIDLVKAKAAAQ